MGVASDGTRVGITVLPPEEGLSAPVKALKALVEIAEAHGGPLGPRQDSFLEAANAYAKAILDEVLAKTLIPRGA